MLTTPWSRLVARAILAGVVAFATTLHASDDPFGRASLLAAAVAAGWAAVEIVTPINRSVGPGSS